MVSEDRRSRQNGSGRPGCAAPAISRRHLRCGCAWGAILAGASSLALGLATGPAAADEIIDGGQIVTVPGDHNSPWNLGPDDLIVGQTGSGTLIIQNGAIVIPNAVQIGVLGGSNGTVTVTGANSTLDSSVGSIRIGLDGTGLLAVENGASLTSNAGIVLGEATGGEGILRVTGDGSSFVATQQVTVGSQGTGWIHLEAGATAVHGGDLTLGLGTHRSGYVTVSGQGTSWEAQADAVVGDGGNGDLQIRGGASFDVAQDLVIGNAATGNGSMVVNGAGSRATFGELRAGVDGYGFIWVEDGGHLGSAGRDILLGVNVDGEAGLQASGAGSRVTGGTLVVGDFGKGSLTATSGTVVETTEAYLGRESGSSGYVDLAGGGTYWHNGGNLFVGYLGQGSLTAQSGARFDSVVSAIGTYVGSVGSVIVHDVGST